MASAPNNNSLSSDQIPIDFWYKRGLNPRFFIQPSETLPVELTRTYTYIYFT